MLHDEQCSRNWTLEVDGVQVNFSLASKGTKVNIHAFHAFPGLITQQLGDYGYLTDSRQFFRQGNIFSDFESVISEVDITPRQKIVAGYSVVDTDLSLPNNPAFNSFLASLAPRLTNSYLVTCIVQYREGESSA